jgi:hypothetical protein
MNRFAGTEREEYLVRPQSRLLRAASVAFTAALRLYPRRFSATFGDEMAAVFNLALEDAAAQGALVATGVIARELAELPVSLLSQHIEERRRGSMTLLSSATLSEIRLARWLARALSLLLALFVLSIILFNEDVRANPTLPMLVFGALTLGLLVAWRWEKAGGLGVMLASPLLLLSIWLHWANVSPDSLLVPRLGFVPFGVAASLGFAALGWLFVSVGQHTGTAGSAPDAPRDRRRSLAVIAVLGTAALILLVGPTLIPVGRQVEMTGESLLPAAYEPVLARLRAEGAVIGVGSPPITHPDLAVEGLVLDIDGATVHAFAFTDVPAAEAAANRILDGLGRSFRYGAILLFYNGTEPGTLAILEQAFGPALDER